MKTDKKRNIKEYVCRNKYVRTMEIVHKFSYSESTVRRLVSELHDSGDVIRCRGGAFSPECLVESADTLHQNERYATQKKSIANRASLEVRDHETILLLGGTTVSRMCKQLKGKSITVATNSLYVFEELRNETSIELILLGGLFNKKEAECSGMLPLPCTDDFICDRVFMGVSGYVRKSGFSTSDLNSVELYNWCIKVSKKVYVLIDSSKFSIRGKGITAKLKDVDVVITDKDVTKSIVHELEEYQTKVLVAKEKENENY